MPPIFKQDRAVFAMTSTTFKLLQIGFTLVEMVVVIVVMAIIGTMTVSFVRLPVQGYVQTESIASLVDEADTALRRMHRDLSNALPNSVRTTNLGASYYIEFVPILAAGRYRANNDATGVRDILDFDTIDASFDVLGPAISVQAGEQLVVYNMGQDGADVYQGLNRRAFAGTQTNVNNLNLTATTNPLPYDSPSRRFYVVNTAVSYLCNPTSGELVRYEYALPAPQASMTTQRISFNGLTPRVLASNVQSCEFSYADGVLQRSGVATISLTLGRNIAGQTSPTARLIKLVNIVNSP